MADVGKVLRSLGGKQVRIHRRLGYAYENPVVGVVERVTTDDELLLRVHPSRLDAIPVEEIAELEVLNDDDA
jgi:hypothetical protein